MNKQETIKLMAAIQAIYPRFCEGATDDIRATVTEMWYMAFEGIPYETATQALLAHFSTNKSGFPPVAAQLIGLIVEDKESQERDAWELAKKAMRNGGRRKSPKDGGGYRYLDEYKKLPSAIQRAIGSYITLREWADINTELLNTVIYSQFIKSYQQAINRETEKKMIPRSAMARLGDKVAIGYVP